MHALPFMVGALCVLAIAYRYYSAFIAAKVLALDGARKTPAHELNDGQNFHPTSKWVLFGHHFAAITGAGPLVGPVLAAQFGFLPGYLWILVGVVGGGAVHDLVILTSSVRRQGRSLAEIARSELGPVVGAVAGIAILFIVIIALAGLGRVVVGALAESSWGVFTIGVSIPLAFAMGIHIYKVRGGSARGVREASVAGVVVLVLAVIFGRDVGASSFGHFFKLGENGVIASIAAYGFVASVLPVWMLLCPRDYLSSYMKLGTIVALVAGIVVVNPLIEMPMWNDVTAAAVHVANSAAVDTFAPVVKGSLFPFVFITIACGAISGFHALIGSGTTPKMISDERDCRTIGYGAMLCEGLVGITALLAATALPPADYFAINTDPKVSITAIVGEDHAGAVDAALLSLDEHDRKVLGIGDLDPTRADSSKPAPQAFKLSQVLHLSNKALASFGFHVDAADQNASQLSEADFARLGVKVTDLPALSAATDEVTASRTGGAVSLAVGMARVFSGLPGMKSLLAYWYHFAIMFEALFVLTTIDTGTRVGRFLLHELLGRAPFLDEKRRKLLGNPSWLPGALATTALIVAGWTWLISSGSISIIWPMFGIANQLLASVALVVGTTILLRESKRVQYALVTFLPLLFVGTTTLTAGVRSLGEIYVPMIDVPATHQIGIVCTAVTAILIACVALILVVSAREWAKILRARRADTSTSPAA